MLNRIIQMLTLRRTRKAWAARCRLAEAMELLGRFPRHPDAPRHDLPSRLIVSLTSYPERFGSLHLTIKSLLDQTVRPDRVILWIDRTAGAVLPQAVRNLEGDLFSVKVTEDVRSFTKIVPTLLAYPDAFIVTADDDIYYPDFWLKRLTDAFDSLRPTIVYHRGHRIRRGADGRLAPYASWERRVKDQESLSPGVDVFPTGVGGVLYPPASLPEQTTDLALIKRLSPTCDDSWLYFMWRQTSWKAKRAPGRMPKFVEGPATQRQSLQAFHLGGMKDQHLQALSDEFGNP